MMYSTPAGSERLEFENRSHLRAIAAQAMRHILIDSALMRPTQKRGGGVRPATIDNVSVVAEGRSDELLALEEARAARSRGRTEISLVAPAGEEGWGAAGECEGSGGGAGAS
ncbi:MAG: hypothetical protein H0U66_03545 [Gemmatimonadaceae bacterium]|nr:hypothetical protein [Gemmatimonadaceae bacterium]